MLPIKFQASEPSDAPEEDLVEAHQELLHTKYQGPRPTSFVGDVV